MRSDARKAHGLRVLLEYMADHRLAQHSPATRFARFTGRSPAAPARANVIDDIKALKHGGNDTPDDMQWQTRAAAKTKVRVV